MRCRARSCRHLIYFSGDGQYLCLVGIVYNGDCLGESAFCIGIVAHLDLGDCAGFDRVPAPFGCRATAGCLHIIESRRGGTGIDDFEGVGCADGPGGSCRSYGCSLSTAARRPVSEGSSVSGQGGCAGRGLRQGCTGCAEACNAPGKDGDKKSG